MVRLLLASVLMIAIFAVSRADGCATASKPGTVVTIVNESALIIWDKKTKTQHFIRRASFVTPEPYFGFLVPTPTIPDLAEVPNTVFQSLEEWTRPKTITRTRYEGPSFGCGADSKDKKGAEKGDRAPGQSVEVLGEQIVAGFKAVKLKATDAKALRDWLEEHGYDARPQLTDWLEPYIKAGWIITAFQIAKTEKATQGVQTQAVRMSFKTDTPFFPYREPTAPKREKDEGEVKDEREAKRHGRRTRNIFRLFVLSTERMQGGMQKASGLWDGKTAWANQLDEAQLDTLSGIVGKGVKLPADAFLTVFDDESPSCEGRGDLYFSPSEDQSAVERPPIIRYETIDLTFPSCVGACGLLFLGPLALLIWRFGFRRKKD